LSKNISVSSVIVKHEKINFDEKITEVKQMIESVKIDYYRKFNKRKPFRVAKKEFEDEALEAENRQYRNRINIVEKEVNNRIQWDLELGNESKDKDSKNNGNKNVNKNKGIKPLSIHSIDTAAITHALFSNLPREKY
jgi:hypothetical protein